VEAMRVRVLAGAAVAAVLTFLLAPTSGRFGRVPLMVLLGVLALIWHLAVSGHERSRDAGTEAADHHAEPVVDLREPAPGHGDVASPPGWFDLPPPEQRPVRTPRRTGALTMPPPAPPAQRQDWPPVQVEVPRVFTMEVVPAAQPPSPAAPPPQPVAQQPPPVEPPPVEPPPVEPPPVADPWLEWAASMFAAPESRSD
jgi:hypothetical protein